MAMKVCKECKKEVSSSAKKCPNCGKDQRNFFMKHKIISFIGVVVLIGIIGSAAGGNKDKSATVTTSNTTSNDTKAVVDDKAKVTTADASKKSTEVVAKVGDTIKTDKFEITVVSVEERKEVGSQYFKKNPSEGGTYLCIQWKYKNISDKPIGTFSSPTLEVLDKNKVKYSSDVSATSSYATELKNDSKILSDLNPGITVNDAKVFEISKEAYASGGWRLHIKADKDSYINLN